jgi:hypothetical protein
MSSGVIASRARPVASTSASLVRAPAFLSAAFSFENASSMGFSMRRHILSRANVVALERQLEISQSPFTLRFYSHSV